MTEELKSVKQIAAEIGRGRTYVQAVKSAMRTQGIEWPCGMMTTSVFMAWVVANRFRCTKYVSRKR